MIQRPKVTSSGLNENDHKILVKELTKYAQEGASDEDLVAFKKEFVAQKKKAIQKESSRPITQEKPLESSISTQKQATLLATEEPKQAQASDGLSGQSKYRLQGEKQAPLPKETGAEYNLQQNKAATKPTTQQQRLANVELGPKTATPAREIIEPVVSKQQKIQEVKNKIFSVDQAKIDKDVADEESKNQGILNGIKAGLTGLQNYLGWGDESKTGKLEIPVSVPYEDYIKKTDKSLSKEQRLAQAKQMFIQERAKNQIDLNAEAILSSTDPYVQEALKTEAIKNLKVNTKDKAIAVQIQALNNDLEELSKNPTPENLQRINDLQNQYKSLTTDYKKNKYKLSPEDQVKLFSLNYGAYDKFTGDLTAGLGRMFGGAFNLAGELSNKGIQEMKDIGILPKGLSQENLDIIKEKNPFAKIGEGFTSGAEKEQEKYRQVSLSDIANSPEPVSEFGRWAGQTVNGIFSFALPFLVGEGEAQLGAKIFIGASGAGNKAYEVNRENKDFKVAAADAYAKGYDKFEFDGKEYETSKVKGKELYSELKKFSVAAGYGLVDYYMAGGRLNSLKGGAKAMETALGDNIAKEQFENGLKGALLEAKGVAGSIAKKAHHGGALFAKVEAAKMFLDDKVLDKKTDNPIERLAQAYGDGVAMDLFAQGSPMLFGYVVGKVAPNKNVVEIKNNTKKILDYEKALEEANEQDKVIINSSIKELNDKNYKLVMKAYDQTRGMTPKQIETLLDIEKQKINIKKDAEYIKSEESELDVSDKKEILKGLKSKFGELENQKLDVFNSEFSALKVLDQKEQDRLTLQAKSELGEGVKEDLINRRAVEIHRVELAKQVKEAPVVEDIDINIPENKDNIKVVQTSNGFALFNSETNKPIEEYNSGDNKGVSKSYESELKAQERLEELKAEKPTEEKVVPLHETIEGLKDLGKREKLRAIDKNIDRIIKELRLETKNCD